MHQPLKRPASGRPQASSLTYSQFEQRTLLATFTGTTGNDFVAINISNGTAEVSINGTSTTLAAPETIEIDALDRFLTNDDRVTITRTAGVDAVFGADGAIAVGGFSISLENFRTLNIPDGIIIRGTDGDDLITEGLFREFSVNGSPATPTISSNTLISIDGRMGLDRVEIFSGGADITVDGQNRVSWLNVEEVTLEQSPTNVGVIQLDIFGTDDDDVLTFENGNTILDPSVGPRITLTSEFDSDVRVFGGDGNDVAFFRGASGALTEFTSGPTFTRFTSTIASDKETIIADGFEGFVVTGSPDDSLGAYRANITGSADADSVVLSDNAVEFSGDSRSIEVRDFELTDVRGEGGDDSVQIDTLVNVGTDEFGLGTVKLTTFGDFEQDYRFFDFPEFDFTGESVPSFSGTDGDDVVSINVGTDTANLVINDVEYTVADLGEIVFDGLGGNDRVSITRPDGGGVAFENGAFSIGTATISLENFEELSVPDGFIIPGTEGDDKFELNVFQQNQLRYSLNGTRIDLPPIISTDTPIAIDGGNGQDRLELVGFVDRDGLSVAVNRAGRFSWANLEEVIITPTMNGLELEIVGTDGDDVLTTDGYRVTLLPSDGPSLTIGQVDSSTSVAASYRIIAGEGNDVASFSPNDSQDVTASFDGSPTSSTYNISGTDVAFAVTAEGFDSVSAEGNRLRGPNFPNDNSDASATITGSESDEIGIFTKKGDGAGVIFSGEIWSIEVTGFDEATVSGGGGNDTLQAEFDLETFFDDDVFLKGAANLRPYWFEEFDSFDHTGNFPVEIFFSVPDATFELDYSVSPAILNRSDSSVSITSMGGFNFHDTSPISIIAPQSESVTFSDGEFITSTSRSVIGFRPTRIEGHSDEGVITIEDTEVDDAIGDPFFDNRLIFNGTDAVLTTARQPLIATNFRKINVVSRGGEDSAFLRGAEGGGNTFVGDSTSATLTTPETTINVINFDLASAFAEGENNVATLIGTEDDEQYYLSPTSARIEGSNFVLNASDFGQTNLEGTAGDTIAIIDSAGDDRIVARPNFTEVEFSEGQSGSISGIPAVRAVSSTGDDVAILGGSDGDDRFVATPYRFGRLSGTGFSLVAASFPRVTAFGQGGDDDAFLNDSVGNDSFNASQTSGSLTGSGFSHLAIDFEAVHALATEGNDTASLRGSENDESYFASPAVASLTGSDFFAFASGFDLVRAVSGGGDDTANLRDSDGYDSFKSNRNFATLQGGGFQDGRHGFENQAAGFARVRAISTGGNDEAILEGTNAADEFFGSRSFSFLRGAEFHNQVDGFENVFASGLSSNSDTAIFIDSEEDDTFVARGDIARLLGNSYLIQISSFETVELFGSYGGTDRLFEDSPNFDLNVFGSFL